MRELHISDLTLISGGSRVDSPYAIELFGNENATFIPHQSKIFINANDCHMWDESEIIANGIKIKLNGSSRSIIQAITQHQGIQIDALVARFPDRSPHQIENFILEMTNQDILAIHLPA